MSDASRFPQLALPFAIVGAAAGWLSAGLVSNPLIQRFVTDPHLPATLVSAASGAISGALLTRFCRRSPVYLYSLEANPSDEADAEGRPPTDSFLYHVLVLLTAGAVTGGIVAFLCNLGQHVGVGVLAGLGCAVAFVPVCLAVINAARRSKRARLGSLVSDSDRRAVWGILATTLAVTTVEAVPCWPAHTAGEAPSQLPAALMLLAAGAVILGVLIADIRGFRRAKTALGSDLEARDPTQLTSDDVAAPRLDLGLGDDIGARIARSSAAYRGRDRVIALVQGDFTQTVSSFRGAFLRGGVGLVIVAAIAYVHGLAQTDMALSVYDQERCGQFAYGSCERLGDAASDDDPASAEALWGKACGAANPTACYKAGDLLQEQAAFPPRRQDGAGVEALERAKAFYQRACKYRFKPACDRLTQASMSF